MALILERPWDSQPQERVAPSQAVSHILYDAVLFGETDNYSVIGKKSTIWARVDGPTKTVWAGEPAERFAFPTSKLNQSGASSTTFSGGRALLIRLYLDSLDQVYAYAAGNGTISLVAKSLDIASNWGFYDGVSVLSSGETLYAARWHNLMVCHDDSVVRFYRDGKFISSSPANAAAWGSAPFTINDFSAFDDLGIAGAMAVFARFDGHVPDGLASDLTGDIWGTLLEPRRIYTPGAAAGAGVPTLSAATYMPGSLTPVGFRPRVTAT